MALTKDLIDRLQEKLHKNELQSERLSKLTQVETEEIINQLFESVVELVVEDETLNIKKVGKFKLTELNERQGVNPQTREKITIPARKKLSFKPAKEVTDTINEK